MSVCEREGMLLVISGPSGTGKGTLAKALLERDGSFCFSTSATTRKPRETEIPDQDYFFLTEEEFDQRIASGDFLEFATVHEHRYGTPLAPVLEQLKQGRNVLLDIDPQGARSVAQRMQNCVTVFLLPPSYEDLHTRLHTRNTEDETEIARRLFNARGEIEQIDKYQYILINDNLSDALAVLEAIVTAEKHATVRYFPSIPEKRQEETPCP